MHAAAALRKVSCFSIKVLALVAILLVQTFFCGIFSHDNDSNHAVKIARAAVSDAWYDSAWSYRKTVTVSGSTADLADYQIRQTITYEPGKMNADFSDLRFVSPDGTTLYDYYIESETDSVSAVAWIEIPSLPTSGTYFFMYYGNDAAASRSDKDGTLDKWTQAGDADFRQGVVSDALIKDGGVGADINISWNGVNGWSIYARTITAPTLADLDGDGDKDMILGENDGVTMAYENIPAGAGIDWVRKASWDFPDDGSTTRPALADLDQDGDFDAIIGNANGISYAYLNAGSASSPLWSRHAAWDVPDIGFVSSPELADLDGDGDYDLMVGTSDGLDKAYKNTGTVNSPVWTREVTWDAVDAGDNSYPALADLDADGDYDLIVGNDNGNGIAYKNTGSAAAPVWTSEVGWNLADVGTKSCPALADLDADGDFDAIVGSQAGFDYAYKNTGSAAAPVWTREMSWEDLVLGASPKPAAADLDADGDYDLMVFTPQGGFVYRNTGSASTPVWTSEPSWEVQVAGTSVDPALVDLDNDGDYDLMVSLNGIMNGYKNVGTVHSPVWQRNAAWDYNIQSYGSPAFADLDNDGDYDLVNGLSSGMVYASENIGSPANPSWAGKAAWGLGDVTGYATPDLVDLDGDGDYDLMFGNSGGAGLAYKNIGTRSSPVWAIESGWNLADIGANTSPTLVDINGDGSLDVIIGEGSAGIRVFTGAVSYLSAASFISSSFDPAFSFRPQSIAFTAVTPSHSSLRFQLAANTDDTTWNFTGPDGTNATYYQTSGESINPVLNDNRYLRYRAYLETTDATVSPVLSGLTIYYAQSAESEPGVSISDSPQAMDHFVISAAETEVGSGDTTTLTISAVDQTGTTFAFYQGDKSVTFSGASGSGAGIPVFIDKDGHRISFGAYGTLIFTNGVAVTEAILYQPEIVRLEMTDGAYTSPSPVVIEVASKGGAFVSLKPLITLADIISGSIPENVVQVAISRHADFQDVSWQDLDRERLHTITDTVEMLYVKFRTKTGGVSNTTTISPQKIFHDGDIVKTPDSCDVYIIKYKNGKRYKRLILSPGVFDSYLHLRWGDLQIIEPEELDAYRTSSLVWVRGEEGVYELIPEGDVGRRRVYTGEYDPDSAYEINEIDRDSYVPETDHA